MDAFDTAMQTHEQSAQPSSVASPETNTQNLSSDPQTPGKETAPTQTTPESIAQTIAELEKLEKFKFQGQEWTPKDLEKAILRQKDYTSKTSTLSEERKSFDQDRKFYENLAWDLQKLRENPSLVNAFIGTYPAKFHAIAAEYLKSNQPTTNEQQTQGASPQGLPQVDVTLLSRLDQLEKSQHQREIKVHEQEIENIRTDLNQKYPNVNREPVQKMILAEAFELFEASRAQNPDFKLSREDWENIYKSTSEQIAEIAKAEYGNLVKKQTEANSKAKDVGAGGGTVGSAPVKFKRFDDLAKHAESIAKGG